MDYVKTLRGFYRICTVLLCLAYEYVGEWELNLDLSGTIRRAAYTLSGQGRSDRPVIVENRLVLAAGDIERVNCGSFSAQGGEDITDPEEIKTLVSLLESGAVVEELPHLRFSGVALGIAYDEERMVSVCTTPGGEFVGVLFHGLPWVEV